MTPRGGRTSRFNAVSYTPPQVIFSDGPRPGERDLAPPPHKDSVANAERTGEFVVNIATWPLRKAMNRSSAQLPAGVDEFEVSGPTKEPGRLIKPPRVKESPVQLECVTWR